MNAKKQITQLKKLSARRDRLMEKVQALDTQINDALSEIQIGKPAEKKDYPEKGSGPYKLCKVMNSRPKSKQEIAQKSGLAVSTVTAYLTQFNCFESAGRGKGYIYNKPKAQS